MRRRCIAVLLILSVILLCLLCALHTCEDADSCPVCQTRDLLSLCILPACLWAGGTVIPSRLRRRLSRKACPASPVATHVRINC